jgi:hypothetical protein
MAASLAPKRRAGGGVFLPREATRTGPAKAFGRTLEDRGDPGRRQGIQLVAFALQAHRRPSPGRRVFTTFFRVFPMSPPARTYPSANFSLVNARESWRRRPAFRLPVEPSRVAQVRATGRGRGGSVGEQRGLGRGQRDEIIYGTALFTILLERARLSGGWRELESRFDPSEGCGMGSLVNASRLMGRAAARALPQAAQWFALAR